VEIKKVQTVHLSNKRYIVKYTVASQELMPQVQSLLRSFAYLATLAFLYSVCSSRIQTILSKPPRLGALVLGLCLPCQTRDNVLGDLTEDYAQHKHDRGHLRAYFWYYEQVTVSLVPLIWQRIKASLFFRRRAS
jgi:hypothetical protein